MAEIGERLFGTDGIRGIPGRYPLTDGMVFKIGCGIARFLYCTCKRSPLKVVIGKDTRLSGQRIESILTNAIASYGIDVVSVGIVPTPALAFLVEKYSAGMGIMISASHNKPTDNGIKFFREEGIKLSSQEEEWIEQLIMGGLIYTSNGITPSRRGYVVEEKRMISSYINFLKSTLESTEIDGLKIVLDCAWGATSVVAKKLFKSLKVKVLSLNDLPDGKRINAGGALNPAFLKKVIIDNDADVGFAFDGDGDRLIVVDEKGNVLDGDYIMAIMSIYLLNKKRLSKNTLVTTVMSNYGLTLAMEKVGVNVIQTKVGDKFILERLIKEKVNFGGEQSGHIIFLDYLPTPDGILTALQLLKVMKETAKPLSILSKVMYKLPQVLVNVRVREKIPFERIPAINQAITQAESQLNSRGRVLLRYSGTESLARIMVEADSYELVKEVAHNLAEVVKREIGIGDWSSSYA
ncbi:MAG: phosphoglucosamine mutase [Candidatus Omnitrophota bacterium]|nr:MAG: phosphoglucosamine mutase [Candidatus Omnitrophota bacterium]